MASSPSALLKLEDMTNGEKDGTWGDITDVNFQSVEQAIAGEAAIAVTTLDVTLTDTQYTENESRKAVLAVTGVMTGDRAIIVPARTKLYVVKNGTTNDASIFHTLTIKVTGQTGVTCMQGRTTIVYCNGTDCEIIRGGDLYSDGDGAGGIESIGAGATIGPTFKLYRNSESPADADVIGALDFDGNDDGDAQTTFARIHALINDVTGATEDGSLIFSTMNAGTLTEALRITAPGQIKFPAAENASSDANTLDDYQEGTDTLSITFATPDDLSVTYANQSATYTKIGRFVFYDIVISTSDFTHTGAAGSLSITGFTFTNHSGGNLPIGGLMWGGITKANYTDISLRMLNDNTADLVASGSGQAATTVTAADMPSGGSIVLRAAIAFIV